MSTHSADPPDRAPTRRGHYPDSPLRGTLPGGQPEASSFTHCDGIVDTKYLAQLAS